MFASETPETWLRLNLHLIYAINRLFWLVSVQAAEFYSSQDLAALESSFTTIAATDRACQDVYPGEMMQTAVPASREIRLRGILTVAFSTAALGILSGCDYLTIFSPAESQNPNGYIRLTGHVEVRQVELSFGVSERIEAIFVDEGQKVRKGQLLARLRKRPYEIAVKEAEAMVEHQQQVVAELESGSRPEEIRRAQAELAAAQAELEDAKRIYERISSLWSRGAASDQDLDSAKSTLERATARYQAAKANLELVLQGPRKERIEAARALLNKYEAALDRAKYQLEQTDLIAPADGVIEERLLEPGDWAAPGKPAFVISLTEPLWIRTFIPEPYLGSVKPGMRVKIRADNMPDRTLTGRVGHIATTAEFTPRMVETPELRTQLVYEARIWVEDGSNSLRLGQPVDVLIPISPETSASK